MILHIPHASTNTLGKAFLCDLELELQRMTDVATDMLYDYPNATRIVFPVSRLICDVERFEDDTLEVMASRGMGVCYTHTAYGEPLRILEEGERDKIIEKYYRPHHQALTDAVSKELEEYGQALIVDCHSFPNDPLPCDLSQKTPRPDICIGTDAYHTSMALVELTKEYFVSCGYTVSIDDPFAGTLVPMKYYHSEERVQSIMLEVNRDLYMNNFKEVHRVISNWLDTINNTKEMQMKEQGTQRDFSPEAAKLLKEEIPKLSDSEYQDMMLMLGNYPKEISLSQAQTMLYAATHPDEAEAQMFSPHMKLF